jgi:hypothetical protein
MRTTIADLWAHVPNSGDSVFEHHLVFVWSADGNTYGVWPHGWDHAEAP